MTTTYTGPNPQVTLGDARNGATVLLADGRSGRIQYLSRDHQRATVHMGGRHFRVPANQIVRVLQRGDQR